MQSTLENLVAGLVDYAGLFPPAEFPMQKVVENFARYGVSPQRTMLGRLVVPVARLGELESEVKRLAEDGIAVSDFADGSGVWRISVLMPAVENVGDHSDSYRKFLDAVAEVEAFNQSTRPFSSPQLSIDSCEIKVLQVLAINEVVGLVPTDTRVFLEIDAGATLDDSLAQIFDSKRDNVYAKLRTGSVLANEIPSVEDVARFIAACVRYDVGFKATAGLHHAWRGEYPLTYEADSRCGRMHGFMNVVVAAMLAFEFKMQTKMIEQILSVTSGDEFLIGDGKLRWREFVISGERISHWRQRGFLSFGSCSFGEPANEIRFSGANDDV